MALPVGNNAETGTSGTTITTGNSGGTNANAFDGVTPGTNMTNTYDGTKVGHGSLAFKTALTSTTTAITYLEYTSATFGSVITEVWGALYLSIVNGASGAPTSSLRFLKFMNGATQGYGIKIESGGSNMTQSIMTGANATTGTIGGTGGGGVGTVNRLEFHFVFNTASGTVAEVRQFSGDGTTQLNTPATLVGVNIGTGFDGVRIGCNTANFSSTSGAAFYVDDIYFAPSTTTTWVGPGPYTLSAPTSLLLPNRRQSPVLRRY